MFEVSRVYGQVLTRVDSLFFTAPDILSTLSARVPS